MKEKKGFTLIEMVIVIVCVIILSTTSVPLYKNYIRQAKLAEAYSLIGQIRDSQFAYYNEYGRFLAVGHSSMGTYGVCTGYEPILGVDARGNKYFTLFSLGNSGEYDYNSTVTGAGGRIVASYNKNNKGFSIDLTYF